VLLESRARIETVAIPWLHVIREHPTFLENYTNLFECSRRRSSIRRCLLGGVRAFAIHARQVARCIQSNGESFFVTKKVPKAVDYLFVSHLLSAAQISQPYDFYFGDVPEKLAARGFSVAIALINHTSQSGSFLVNRLKKSGISRIILSHSLSFCDEGDLYLRLRKEANRLRAVASCKADALARRVYFRGAEEALSNGALGALRVGQQIGRLVAQTRAKTLVLTHEGYSWERVCFSAARSVEPKIQCIGYQHAAVFRLQHALRRNLSSEYNPDQIVTAGLVGKKQLEASPKLQKIPISVLGSNRSISLRKRTQLMKKSIRKQIGKDSVCLVLPEGIPSECQHLFIFSIACSKAFPDIKFIWRLHPIVAFQKLCRENPQYKNLPNNVSISSAPLRRDFARSNIVLYRGSTAAVQAVAAGLRPIYLQVKNEMRIDPMHEVQECIPHVKDVSEFGKAINSATFLGSPEERLSQLRVLKYSRTFFAQLQVATLARIGERASRRGNCMVK